MARLAASALLFTVADIFAGFMLRDSACLASP
jgi:hypothetical protein